MAFDRKNYQEAVDFGVVGSTTIDLVPAIGADERLVISRVRVQPVSNNVAYCFIYKIPSGGTESEDTAILHNFELWPGQSFDESNIVLNAGEGLAVGINNGGSGTPKVVFTAMGELETGIT